MTPVEIARGSAWYAVRVANRLRARAIPRDVYSVRDRHRLRFVVAVPVQFERKARAAIADVQRT